MIVLTNLFAKVQCPSVMQLGDCKDVGTSLIQDQPPLLLKSTIKCNYGGVDITITDCGQKCEPEEIDVVGAPVPPPLSSKKFLVHFRRPSNYKGEFGFDWLRDEYIYPITSVNGINKELSLDIPKLKTEYKTTDVTNPISPYQKDYYSSFLNIMLNQEVTLDIEVEELEALSLPDATEIIFESSNPKLTITPARIPLSTLIAGTKLGGTTTREYYSAVNQVKVKCDGQAFTKNEQIKVFAKLVDNGVESKKEVGKMMVMKNSDQAKYTINVYVIKAFMSDNPLYSESVIDTEFAKIGGLAGLEKYLNENSLNQGLIQVKLIDKKNLKTLKIDLSTSTFNLANKGFNTMNSKPDKEYEDLKGIITNPSPTKFEVDSGKSVDLFNKQSNKLYGFDKENCILLYLCPLTTKDAGGSSYTYPLNNKHCIIFGKNLYDSQSYAHEIAHTLGLEHTFLDKDSSCNLISLTDEKNKINQETNDFKRKVEEVKRKVDAEWLKYKQENNAYFTQYPSKIPEYKKPYDDNKVSLDKQFRDYEKKQNERLSIVNNNNIRFIRAFTENIMDYWSDDTNCDGSRDVTGITKKISFNKYQWKIIQNEAKTYYH